tara:strand:+ start:2830 stop:3081 length:252 start_codon:yes stop_codon:yes gene_type:complete
VANGLMEVTRELSFTTEVGNFEKNIELKMNKGVLELGIGKKTLFSTLKHRKEIVGLLNKKLDELVEEFISKQTNTEQKRNMDL